MARGLMTALQAALAGVAGGASGYAQYQAQERKRLQEEKEAEERQALNLASLYEKGFMTPEQLARRQERQQTQASGAVGRAIMGSLTPMAGVAPPTGRDIGALSEALATAGREPAQRLRFGGQELVRAETPQMREERLGTMEVEQQQFAAEAARRAQAESQTAARIASRQEEEDKRKFQLERDEAKQKFDALQNSLDRQARAALQEAATGGAGKRPTEAQERNAVYYNLMSNGQRELDALRENPEIRPWAITAYLNTPGAAFGRGLLSDAEQQFIRAAQDFTAGVLRKETGAAATRGEVAQTLERYIEMGGEQPGSARAKSEARQRVTDAMRVSAMPALEYARQFETPREDEGASTATRSTSRPPLSSFRRRPR